MSRPVAELPPFPKDVQRRLTRKGPSHLNPWKAGKLAINYESAEALSQQDDTKNIRKTPEPACEHTDASDKTVEPACEDSDASDDEGFTYLSGSPEKQHAPCPQTPINTNCKRRNLTRGATPEAISRLIKC